MGSARERLSANLMSTDKAISGCRRGRKWLTSPASFHFLLVFPVETAAAVGPRLSVYYGMWMGGRAHGGVLVGGVVKGIVGKRGRKGGTAAGVKHQNCSDGAARKPTC